MVKMVRRERLRQRGRSDRSVQRLQGKEDLATRYRDSILSTF